MIDECEMYRSGSQFDPEIPGMACKFIDVSVMLTLVCSRCGENVEGELKRFRGESELKIEPCKHCIEAAAREQLETAVAA